MSTVKVIMPDSGFVAWTDANGVRQETILTYGDEYRADADIVRARPDVFSTPEKPAATTKRRRSMDGAEEA
jgi:hypothetical protein